MKRKVLMAVFSSVLLIQSAGCGMILHPERQGQKDGRLDPAIVAFDAAGLLLFIVPGVVAFGIDFYYGTIYLPDSALNLDESELNLIQGTEKEINLEALADIASEKLGQPVDKNELLTYAPYSVDELKFFVEQSNALSI